MGKTLQYQQVNEQAGAWTIPIGAPQSQVVAGFFGPLERLITPDHTEPATCLIYGCEK
jgi:hypothetical protein